MIPCGVLSLGSNRNTPKNIDVIKQMIQACTGTFGGVPLYVAVRDRITQGDHGYLLLLSQWPAASGPGGNLVLYILITKAFYLGF